MISLSQEDRQEVEEKVAGVKKFWPVIKAVIQDQISAGVITSETLGPDDLDWVLDVDYLISSGIADLLLRIAGMTTALKIEESKEYAVTIAIVITSLRKIGITDFTPKDQLKMSTLRGMPTVPDVPEHCVIVTMGNKIEKGDLWYDALAPGWLAVDEKSVGATIDERTALIARTVPNEVVQPVGEY